MKLEPHDVKFFETPAELRDWFDANHETAADLWLGSYRKGSGKPSVSWSDAVDEALCVGWIDSIRKRLDDTRSAQRFTPRRKGSTWSAINVDKVAALTAEGRMRPAGLRAFEAPDRGQDTAVYSYERAEARLLRRGARAVPGSAGRLGRLGASTAVVPRTVTHWVTSAKGAETRARRLEALIADSAAGQKAGPMRWSREAA